MNNVFFDDVLMGLTAIGMIGLAIWTGFRGFAGWGMRYRYRMIPPKKALMTDKIHIWLVVTSELILALTIILILISKRSP